MRLLNLSVQQGLGNHVALAQSRALHWLERNMRLLEEHGDPYEVAIVAYALMVSKASSAERAFSLLVRHSRNEGMILRLTLGSLWSTPKSPFWIS